MKTIRSKQFIGITATLFVSAIILPGCTHRVKVDPIKVEPIDITLHIYLKADEKLDSFFDYQDEDVPVSTETPAASMVNPEPRAGGVS